MALILPLVMKVIGPEDHDQIQVVAVRSRDGIGSSTCDEVIGPPES